jgi:hypothetical protein
MHLPQMDSSFFHQSLSDAIIVAPPAINAAPAPAPTPVIAKAVPPTIRKLTQ